MTEHGPVAIRPFPGGKLLVACACGDVFAGVDGAVWQFEYDGAGNVRTHPSINLPDHFHTPNPSGWIPQAKQMAQFITKPRAESVSAPLPGGEFLPE